MDRATTLNHKDTETQRESGERSVRHDTTIGASRTRFSLPSCLRVFVVCLSALALLTACGGGATQRLATAQPAGAMQRFAPAITRLTTGGCCRDPFWHPDGSRVLYADSIPNQRLAGTYAVPAEGGPPMMFWKEIATLSRDGARVAFPDFAAGVTRVQEFGKSSIATVSNGAAFVWFSPDGRQVAWIERLDAPQTTSAIDRLSRVWTANADGTNARIRANNVRTSEIQWFPDGRRIVYTGRDANGTNPGIYALDLNTGVIAQLATGFSSRGVRLAPDGQSLVYLATLEANAEANGMWVVRLDTGERRKLPLYGGVRWLPDSSALVMLPTQSDGGADALVRVDTITLAVTPLTDRAALPFRVAQDQWQLSPDGTRIAFVSLDDGNIAVLRFAA